MSVEEQRKEGKNGENITRIAVGFDERLYLLYPLLYPLVCSADTVGEEALQLLHLPRELRCILGQESRDGSNGRETRSEKWSMKGGARGEIVEKTSREERRRGKRKGRKGDKKKENEKEGEQPSKA